MELSITLGTRTEKSAKATVSEREVYKRKIGQDETLVSSLVMPVLTVNHSLRV